MKTIRGFFELVSARLELWAAEVRAGVTLVDAVAADAFESELRAISSDEAVRADMRECALVAARAGADSALVEVAIREHMVREYRSWGGADHA